MMNKNSMKILMIGAHPDDCELRCAGLALKYVRDGHQVRFLSMCDGSGGHHELNRNEIAARRWEETRKVAEFLGVEYDVWNIPDCELMADLETRGRLVRYIREFAPDVVFGHRTNDYHADHRNAGMLLQDASYLLIVPNYCSEVKALPKMPVIIHYEDTFMNPPFVPEVVIGIDDEIETKCRAFDLNVSQAYEWLPYTYGKIEEVPEDKDERYLWMRGDIIDEQTDDADILAKKFWGRNQHFAMTAARFRKQLVERYGENGNRIVFAEAFAACEYGSPLTEEMKKKIFPY